MSRSVTVANISADTSDSALRDFLLFCGQIAELKVSAQPDGTKTAVVEFKKVDGAKTAVMLDGTSLGKNALAITSPDDKEASSSPEPATAAYSNEHEVPQEHKPRRRILAELLAQGYIVGDVVIDKALDFDKTHGFSSRFRQVLESIERQFKPQERVREIDTKYHVSDQFAKTTKQWLTYLNPYLESASKSTPGVTLRAFYNEAAHTAQSVHEEAQWIKKTRSAQKCGCNTAGSECTCKGDSCACDSCPKNKSASQSCSTACAAGDGSCEKKAKGECACEDDKAEKADAGCGCASVEKPQDCGCTSLSSECPCPPGACRCADCAKNPKSANFKDCGCGLIAANCGCPPGECACAGCGKAASK